MLATLIANIASGETLLALRRAKVALGVYIFVALLALLGLGFLLGAAYLFAAARYGPIEAALGFGAGFLVLALLLVIVFKLVARTRRRSAAERRKGELTTLAVATGLALLPALASKRRGFAIVLAPALAMVGYKIWRENSRRDTRPAPAKRDSP